MSGNEEQIFLIPKPINFKPQAIAIACSTGGPQALQTVFSGLKDKLPQLPIFITQHMPAVFTKYLANNLSAQNHIKCHEAHEDMQVHPGNIYLAPGNFHMQVKEDDEIVKIHLSKGVYENFCRPSAEPMLRSLLEVYGHKLLVVFLTGMGQDGIEAAKKISKAGGVIIAQNKETSVVWGMPGSVADAGITSGVYPITEIAKQILEICNGEVK